MYKMIISRINDNMKYESPLENDVLVYPTDEDYDADIYEIEIDGKPVEIAVGQYNDDDPFHLVKYCHVYLLKGDKVIDRIGVTEIEHEEEGEDIDIEDHLLFFSKPGVQKLLNEHAQFGGAEETIEVEKSSPEQNIGIRLKKPKGSVGPAEVVEIAPNHPFGFEVGDNIIKINDADVMSLSVKEIVSLLTQNQRLKIIIDRPEKAGPAKSEPVLSCPLTHIPKERVSNWGVKVSLGPEDLASASEKGVDNSLFQDAVVYIGKVNPEIRGFLQEVAQREKQTDNRALELETSYLEDFTNFLKIFSPQDLSEIMSRRTLSPQTFEGMVAQRNEWETEKKTNITKEVEQHLGRPIDELWIKFLFKDDKYEIINPPGDGHCLFYSLQKALQSIGITTTVKHLRELQRPFINPDKLETMLNIVGPYYKDNADHLKKVNQIAKQIKEKQPLGKTPELSSLKGQYKDAMMALKIQLASNPLPEDTGDVGFLAREKIINAEGEMVGGTEAFQGHLIKFTEHIISSWGDDLTLQILQRALLIKIVIVNMNTVKQKLKHGEQSNLSDYISFVQELGGDFKPEYYLFLNLVGGHYEVITYDHRILFKPDQIPYSMAFLVRQNMLANDKHKDPIILSKNFAPLEQSISESGIESVFMPTPWKLTASSTHSASTAGPFVPSSPTQVVSAIDIDKTNRLLEIYKELLQNKDDASKIPEAKHILSELITQELQYPEVPEPQIQDIAGKLNLTNI